MIFRNITVTVYTVNRFTCVRAFFDLSVRRGIYQSVIHHQIDLKFGFYQLGQICDISHNIGLDHVGYPIVAHK